LGAGGGLNVKSGLLVLFQINFHQFCTWRRLLLMTVAEVGPGRVLEKVFGTSKLFEIESKIESLLVSARATDAERMKLVIIDN
jgi:hypothetical protein